MKTNIVNRLKKLGFNVNEEDYEFLDKTPELHSPILIGLGGSIAYGTNLPTSDVDLRGIALHDKKDILLGSGFEQIVNEKTDTTIYSLKKVMGLLANCNPNVIELMGLKPEHYLYLSPEGKALLDDKDMFLSNRCVNTFMGYANQQMYRLQQKTLTSLSEKELNTHITKTINSMKDTLTERYDVRGIDIHMKDDKIVCDLNIKDYPAEHLSGMLSEINNIIRAYNKRSVRNDKAFEHGKIAKHSMHLLRLYMMCEDLLLYGEINTYRQKEHSLLMDIRNGKYLGEDGKPVKEFFDMVRDYEDRLDKAKEKSVLPDKPDFKRIDGFLMEINEKVLMPKRTKTRERD